jgi:hypothetical protein
MSSTNEAQLIANKNTGAVPAKTTKDGPYIPMWGVNTNKIRQQYWYRRNSAPYDIKPHGYNLMSVDSTTGVKSFTRVEKSSDYTFIGMNTGKECENN